MEQAKRDNILRQASQAFGRLGFKKASIDQIAEMAGVAKGTIYLACQSKADLFYQVLQREVLNWMGEVQKHIDPRKPADELLKEASIRGEEYLAKRPLMRALLFGEAYTYLPGWKPKLDKLAKLGRQNVVQILNIGIAQGRFRDDIDIELVAEMLQDLQLAYFVLHQHTDELKRPAERAHRRDVGRDLILRGLLPREA